MIYATKRHQAFTFTSSICAAFLVAACGGGGDGASTEDDATAKAMVGTYAVSMVEEYDNCGIFGSYSGANHVVTANGSELTVDINTQILKGQATSGGLSVGYDVTSSENVRTHVWMSYSLPPGVTTPNGSYVALLNIEGSTQGFSCLIRLNGTATKIL